jgi:alpha 1,2-mannosyltransferase
VRNPPVIPHTCIPNACYFPQRWGDAPVHSIAVALFLPRDKIHFFSEMGYEHNPYIHCPKSNEAWARGKCTCDQRRSFGVCYF